VVPAGPSSEFTGGTHAAPPSAETSPAPEDPLDRIAKLARLRDSGALTNEEFERQKAKLLAQM
jgi:Short C-terminal domain